MKPVSKFLSPVYGLLIVLDQIKSHVVNDTAIGRGRRKPAASRG